MAKVTHEMLYRELLIIEGQLTCLQAAADDNLKLLKAISSDLVRGRAQIEATKQRFGFAAGEGRCP